MMGGAVGIGKDSNRKQITISRHERMTRKAISPLLAINTFLIILLFL